jgi:hypothetical protein
MCGLQSNEEATVVIKQIERREFLKAAVSAAMIFGYSREA